MSFTYYENLILISDESDFSMKEFSVRLKKFYSKNNLNIEILEKDDSFEFLLKNQYKFHFSWNEDDYVLEESKEIAEQYPNENEQEKVSNCRKRLEMYGDEDFEMEYFNDSLYVLETFESFKGVYIFDNQNGFEAN